MLIFLGKSGAGKTTLCNALEQRTSLKKAVTYTTRDKRPGEVDGVDYHFLTNQGFQEMLEQGLFMEHVCFHDVIMKSGTKDVFYGSAKADYSDPNQMIILNPEGYKNVILNLKDKSSIQSFYLKADDALLEERLQARKDNPEEVKRRLEADRKDFKDLDFFVDVILDASQGIDELCHKVLHSIDVPILSYKVPDSDFHKAQEFVKLYPDVQDPIALANIFSDENPDISFEHSVELLTDALVALL